MTDQSDAEKAAEDHFAIVRDRNLGEGARYKVKWSGLYDGQEIREAFLAGAAWAAPKCDETLIERLKKSRKIICALCKEGRPPHMSVPVQESDEDVFICDSIDMAIRALSRELQEKAKRERVK